MTTPFLGEIKMVGFGFAPRGYAQCNGQILSIAQNTALFALLGTTYGGDGRTTFALPDLRSRVPVHQGQGPGLSSCSSDLINCMTIADSSGGKASNNRNAVTNCAQTKKGNRIQVIPLARS